jgi:hypothetical protein
VLRSLDIRARLVCRQDFVNNPKDNFLMQTSRL